MSAKRVSKETTAKTQPPWDAPKPLTVEERVSRLVEPLPPAPYFDEDKKALLLSEALAWDTLREKAAKARTRKQVEKLIHHAVLAFLRIEGNWPTQKPENQLLPCVKRLLTSAGNRQMLQQVHPAFVSVLAKRWIIPQSIGNCVFLVADETRRPRRKSQNEGDAYYTPSDLAEIHDVPLDALRKRLARYRKKSFEGWKETEDRRSREARFMFSEKAVWPIINALKKGKWHRPKTST